MDEHVLRRIVREEVQSVRGDVQSVREEVQSVRGEVQSVRGEVQSVREEVQSIREEVHSVREEVHSVREEVRASEARLAEAGRLQFRQLADLYRSNVEKVEHLERHLGERIDATRGSIEALRSSLERQDFRADDLGRRLTRLETRTDQ